MSGKYLDHIVQAELVSCKEYLSKLSVEFEIEDLYEDNRKIETVFLKSLIALVLRCKGHTLPFIVNVLGYQDHSSVINLLKFGTYTSNPQIRKRYNVIKEKTVQFFSRQRNTIGTTPTYEAQLAYHEAEAKRLRGLLFLYKCSV